MTAAEQHRAFGAAVEADGDQVILQVGKEMRALTAEQAQRFAYYLARAYASAGKLRRAPRSTNPVGRIEHSVSR